MILNLFWPLPIFSDHLELGAWHANALICGWNLVSLVSTVANIEPVSLFGEDVRHYTETTFNKI